LAAKRKRLMDELPHGVQKKIRKKLDAELENAGFCTITGLPTGMTHEMFDEANGQFRMNKHKEDKDDELDRLTDHLVTIERQTIVTLINYMGDLDVEVGTLVEEHLETLGKHMD
jgi:hypothetical protein